MAESIPTPGKPHTSAQPGTGSPPKGIPTPLKLAIPVVLVLVAVLAYTQLFTSSKDMSLAPAPTTPFVNVKDYGARGDGTTDDTKAIQTAISRNIGPRDTRTLYFPNGVYIVSDSLLWQDGDGAWMNSLAFQGESQNGTIIRLKDGAPGFDNPTLPRGVIVTASGLIREKATGGGKDYTLLGEGNEAFRNFIFDLTVHTGSANPGAMGIDFLGNNVAAVRNVTVRSGDGSGVAGIAMYRKWSGPALFKGINIEGFDYGVTVDYTEYSLTFENITLTGQKKAGILNDSNVLSIRNLNSNNSVPAVQNASELGLVVVIDAALGGGSSQTSAIVNNGEVYLRDVVTDGYASAVTNKGSVVRGNTLAEYASSTTAASAGGSALNLSIEETPNPSKEPLSAWASVLDFGATGTKADGSIDYHDDHAAVQAAIDSGATTIYFPTGRYYFSDTIVIRNNVERIEFLGSTVGIADSNKFADHRPLFRVEEGSGSVVVLDQMGEFAKAQLGGNPAVMVEHASSRTLVIQDSLIDGYRNATGSGPLFLENVCCGTFEFNGQQVWARQLNSEGNAPEQLILNNGGSLWVLGLKTELPSTVLRTSAGGSTEILGGLVYPVNAVPAERPAFINEDSTQTLIYAITTYNEGANYEVQVSNNNAADVSVRDAIRRGLGSILIHLRD